MPNIAMPDIEGILQGYIDLEKRETQDNKGRFKVVHNTSESCFSKKKKKINNQSIEYFYYN